MASVAGIVVATGAQSADLPVKARAVQYVKICTLYGDGYYYIPGSDTCIRFGGRIRAQYGYNAGGGAAGAGIVPGTQLTVTDGLMTRQTAHYSSAHREIGAAGVDDLVQIRVDELLKRTLGGDDQSSGDENAFVQNVA
jgi:hypothetical protein